MAYIPNRSIEFVRLEHIQAIRPIANNIGDPQRILPYIDEVMKFEVAQAFPPGFVVKLYSIHGGGATLGEVWSPLVYGGFVEDDNNVITHCTGLTESIAYLAYSKLLLANPVNVTAYGAVTKRTQFSEPTGDAVLLRTARDAEKRGLEGLKSCYNFAKANGILDECTPKPKHKYKRRFRSLSARGGRDA